MDSEKQDYLNNWLFRAREDLAVIDKLIEAGAEHYTSTICFHAQQATEKYLKAFLVYHDINFPKTHDVDFLLEECRKINDAIFRIDLKSLTEFGVSVRYPDDFYVPSKEEALDYRNIAKNIQKAVTEHLKQ